MAPAGTSPPAEHLRNPVALDDHRRHRKDPFAIEDCHHQCTRKNALSALKAENTPSAP